MIDLKERIMGRPVSSGLLGIFVAGMVALGASGGAFGADSEAEKRAKK